jgi:hypothetical protein
MRPALMKEPQVSIIANLVSQSAQAILIPESIEVSAVLYNSKMDDEIRFIHLETLLVFIKEQAIKMATRQQAGDALFPVTKLKVQKPVQRHYSRLALLTYIRVFNNEALCLNESSLTVPEYVCNLHSIKSWPAVFNLQYRIFPIPGFSISVEADNHA